MCSARQCFPEVLQEQGPPSQGCQQSRTHGETKQLESVLCKLFPGSFATKIYYLDHS